MSTTAESIIHAVRTVAGEGVVPLHEPQFSDKESEYVQRCLESGYVSSVGAYVNEFEDGLRSVTGSAHAVAVTNGTAALHLALRLVGVGPGDEVIVPALSFVATANAVHYCGAIPHFVDSEESTLGMDPVALRARLDDICVWESGTATNRQTGRPIRAIVPMHTFGHPCDILRLMSVASDYGLPLIEDAAEALGSTSLGRACGTFGALGVLSFNGNKIVTAGGGGAVLTDDPELATLAKHLSTTAKVPHRWNLAHDLVGYNYRLPNINAALGCAQLERLAAFVESKRRLFSRYEVAFASVAGVQLYREPRESRSNYWLQTLLLDDSTVGERDAILQETNDNGVMTRPAWELLPRMAPNSYAPCAPLPCAERLERAVINIPSSAGLA